MTAPRRRAGDAMRRGMAVTPSGRQAVETAERHDGVTAHRLRKYTVKLEPEVADEFDGLALRARKKLGRRVDKSEIVKALIRLAADDASLAEQLISELK